MDAGQFDRKITLQRKMETDTGYGTEENGWYAIATVSAELLSVSRPVMERLAAAELNATGLILFRIRRDSAWADLSALDRLLFEGRVHEITFVRQDGRRFLTIDAVARGES